MHAMPEGTRVPFVKIRDAEAIAGTLGEPSKMPGFAYGLPARRCIVGSQLAKLPGTVCSDCYALKGHYVFQNVVVAQEKRFASLRHPQWVDAMVFMISRRKNNEFFRWHDSGDVQGVWHLENLAEVARRLPNTKFWLPTREKSIVAEYRRKHGVEPENLTIRVSGAMVDGPIPLSALLTSTVTTIHVKDNHGATTCPAYKNSGKCGSCRACWDKRIPHVAYPLH